jgi:predicted PhzF superfamily epimerase YddE/YHI9
MLAMDFPARPPARCEPDDNLIPALGVHPEAVLASRDYLVVYRNEGDVKKLRPDMALAATLDRFAIIVTAPGRDCDFVSRFFAPAAGIAEDPVTGSAHCTLVPYWSRRLGKKSLFARQVSARGGELWCEDMGERVKIAGHTAMFLRGEITL